MGSCTSQMGELQMIRSRFTHACSLAGIAALLLASVSLPSSAPAQTRATDPGVRGGEPGAGGPLPGLTTAEQAFFEASKEAFEEVDVVADGLGPRFNLDSCDGCHLQPAVGGTSPAVNPQVDMATKDGARNVVPSFIRRDGPHREA